MKLNIGQLITELQEIAKVHGENLPILGGYLTDDNGVSRVCVLNEHGAEYEGQKGEKVEGVFFE